MFNAWRGEGVYTCSRKLIRSSVCAGARGYGIIARVIARKQVTLGIRRRRETRRARALRKPQSLIYRIIRAPFAKVRGFSRSVDNRSEERKGEGGRRGEGRRTKNIIRYVLRGLRELTIYRCVLIVSTALTVSPPLSQTRSLAVEYLRRFA